MPKADARGSRVKSSRSKSASKETRTESSQSLSSYVKRAKIIARPTTVTAETKTGPKPSRPDSSKELSKKEPVKSPEEETNTLALEEETSLEAVPEEETVTEEAVTEEETVTVEETVPVEETVTEEETVTVEESSSQTEGGQVIPFDNNPNYGDLANLGEGFTAWKIRTPSTNNAGCFNGTVEMTRTCLDAGNPDACLGAIEKVSDCADAGLSYADFSAWSKFKELGSCSNGIQTLTRQCISLDATEPICFGQSSIEVDCEDTADSIAYTTQEFKQYGACQPAPAEYAFDQSFEGCGGTVFTYNGVKVTKNDCIINEAGSLDCSQGEITTEYCMLPGTGCSSDYGPEAYEEGTSYTGVSGNTCGIPIAYISEENIVALPNDIQPFIGFQEPTTSNGTLYHGLNSAACGVGGHKVETSKCYRLDRLDSCFYNIDQIQSGSHKDKTCLGTTREVVGCTHAYSAAQNSNNGVWTHWKRAGGCHPNPELGTMVRVETRRCEKTTQAGQTCEGDSSRYITCSSKYDGLPSTIFITNDIAANAEILSKANAYKDALLAKGADIKLEIVNTQELDSQGLIAMIRGAQSASGLPATTIELIGEFAQIEVSLELSGHKPNSSTVSTTSDLPAMVGDTDAYIYDGGLYRLQATSLEDNINLVRVVARTDFSLHTAQREGLTSQADKYKHYLDKIINVISNAQNTYIPGERVKATQLIDNSWDSMAYMKQSGLEADITHKVFENYSNRGGFIDAFSKRTATASFSAHGSGTEISFQGKNFHPTANGTLKMTSSGARKIDNIKTVDLPGVPSLFEGIPIKAITVNAFNCSSATRDQENNVATTLLLGLDNDTVSVYGSYGVGALNFITAHEVYDTLLKGDTMAQAYMERSKNVTFSDQRSYVLNADMGASYTYGYKWFVVVTIVGSPFALGDSEL